MMKRIFSLTERSHGPGAVFITWQKGSASYLVTAGYDISVNIYNRHGDKLDQINLPGFCSGVGWDYEGDSIGIITDRSPLIILWNSNTRKIQQVDTGVRESLSLIIWSKTSPLLAVGTSKGNVLIYNHRTSRKIPILGKHSKKITHGAWSNQNLLALLGEDKILSITNEEGNTMNVNTLKADGYGVQFASIKLDDRNNKVVTKMINQQENQHNCVSLIVNKKQLYIMILSDADNPFILAFQDKYGIIIDYQWFNDGQILIGFSHGYFVVISANIKEMGQELTQFKLYKESLTAFTICPMTKKIVSSSDNIIKINDLNDLSDIQSVITIDDERTIEWMEYSDDGQLLALVSSSGNIHVYLNKLNILGDSHGTRLAFLSSLLEVTVANISEDSNESMMLIKIDIEPSQLAVGQNHIAIAMNNRIWFYGIGTQESNLLVREQEYVSIVKSVKLNHNYACVMFANGTAQLHSIEDGTNHSKMKIFPDGNSHSQGKITTISLTENFLIYANDNGSIEYFMIPEWNVVNVYKHSVGIKQIYPDQLGTCLVVIDNKNDGWIYNAIAELLVPIPHQHFPSQVKSVLWETWHDDKAVFAVCDSNHIQVFVNVKDTIQGPVIDYIGQMKIPLGQFPLLLYNGVVVCHTQSGGSSNFILSTHDFTDKMNDKVRLKTEFLTDILKLRRYHDAWKICEYLNETELWDQFARQLIYDMEIEMAIRVYRLIKSPGMIYSLEQLRWIEERNLLAGHLAQCLDQYDLAQQLFLISSDPLQALDMRMNLFQWNEALILAKRLSPDLIPMISREFALQLEFNGEYQGALEHFEKSLIKDDGSEQSKLNNGICKAGIARNSIRCGATKKGVDFALQSTDLQVHQECASILESIKLYSDAALLYEKAMDWERAVRLYLKVKNYNKVNKLIDKIDNQDIQHQFARAKEAEGKYQDAVKSYLKCQDWINVVRLYLNHLDNPGEAIRIVKETKSIEGAKMVAKFFQKLNDIGSAIEFLVLSKCYSEAFNLAQTTGQVDTYANLMMMMEDDGHEQGDNDHDQLMQDYLLIAIYYEQEKDYLKAGNFYCLCGQYKKGIKYLLQAASTQHQLSLSSGINQSGESEPLRLCINYAGKSHDESVIRMIIDYLIGETDGEPKDFKYLFRLYMSLKRYREAAKTAVIISAEEQNMGNYKNAHELLFGMSYELKKQNLKIPNEMISSLMLIHSYMLAKIWIRIGDHAKSAHMLIRVSNNLSRFPAHSVPILTSTVIECQRAGFKKKSLEFAMMLMKPENREQIDPKFKRKIENLVRKSAGLRRSSIDYDDNLMTNGHAEMNELVEMNCPFCDNQVIQTELTCNQCKNNIPFCIATGYHIVKDDLTTCPNCQFPAIMTHFINLIQHDKSCPMCGQHVDLDNIAQVQDVKSILYSD